MSVILKKDKTNPIEFWNLSQIEEAIRKLQEEIADIKKSIAAIEVAIALL